MHLPENYSKKKCLFLLRYRPVLVLARPLPFFDLYLIITDRNSPLFHRYLLKLHRFLPFRTFFYRILNVSFP